MKNNNFKINQIILCVICIFVGGIIGFFTSKFYYNIKVDKKNELVFENEIFETNESEKTIYIDNVVESVETNNAYIEALASQKVGNVILFGKYEQDNNVYNGKEDIEWIVLYKSNKNSMLLISKYVLNCLPYNFEKLDVTWQNSYLRNYLNNDFYYEAFDEPYQQFIMENDMTNSDNVNYKTDAGNETRDKVFLLSESQAKKYFPKSDKNNHNQNRSAKATEFAKYNGVVSIVDKNVWYDGNVSYWLRTPGVEQSRAEIIEPTGAIFEYGELITSIEVGIRPCIWLKY